MKERENVLRILEETKKAIEANDAITIKNLSNQTINTASLTQDPDNVIVAVIVYSIGKIYERKDYQSLPGWNLFYKTMINSLNASIGDIQKNNDDKFRKDFEFIRNAINKLSGKLRKYVEEVFQRAKISKASRIYEHGISMEQTAKLLGISLFELAEYTGQTGISDVPLSKTINVKSRIKLAMDLFEK